MLGLGLGDLYYIIFQLFSLWFFRRQLLKQFEKDAHKVLQQNKVDIGKYFNEIYEYVEENKTNMRDIDYKNLLEILQKKKLR